MKLLTDEECDATPTPKIVIVQELRYAVLPPVSCEQVETLGGSRLGHLDIRLWLGRLVGKHLRGLEVLGRGLCEEGFWLRPGGPIC